MKKLIFILTFVLTSCVQYDYVEGQSMYECGIIIGGEVRGAGYFLWIEFPDGKFWYDVTQKTYFQYEVLEEICFDTLQI